MTAEPPARAGRPDAASSVTEGRRGQGVGRTLLTAIHNRARADGIERISLSVDDDNPANGCTRGSATPSTSPARLGRMILTL